MVGAGQVYFDAGETVLNFDEDKLINKMEKIKNLNLKYL